MNDAIIPFLVALIIQSALGLVVFQANWHRKPNQCFLLVSAVAAVWLLSLYYTITASNTRTATLGIREASAAGASIFAAFYLLRVALRWPEYSWGEILARSKIWIVATIGIIGFCQTHLFLNGAEISLPIGSAPPKPIYGVGGWFYLYYFAAAALVLMGSSFRDLRKTEGSQRSEIAFVLIGTICTAIFPFFTVALRSFVDQSRLLWFAPFRVVVFSAVVAYGIATRKIMDVGVFFRVFISYILLTAYLLTLYATVWWLTATALRSIGEANAHSIAHIASAIVVAFAMAPARGMSQRLAERLFISTHRVDFRTTMSKAANILVSVATLSDLLERFATTIAEAVKTDRVAILVHVRDRFDQAYALQPADTAYPAVSLSQNDPLVKYLKEHHAPIVLDELHRLRPTTELDQVTVRMRSLKVAVVMGVFARDHLSSVMFLGPRRSGKIYGTMEQDALQVLCGQLAIAIDNAELFTEVQNARIYNETLLENLTTGVIAVGADERITVFNNEVEQITGLDSHKILDRSVDHLPEGLRGALRETLQTGRGQENGELSLHTGGESLIIRISTSIFHGRNGKVLGALMVLTDITALKRLELQIRRSDRLASLGTLSAGMAHEIKNPLVSIKTFAQLLPERYQDSDFRQTFSNLIGHEIDRIDSLVNQLLRFARPAKPQLEPMHVHQILDKSLLLVGHRLYQKDIKLTRSWDANVDTIRADADQLEQVFLNFFLNAMDAMKNGGELHISTEVRTDAEWVSPLTQSNGETREILKITIRDSGEGIRSEDIAHVFDPFFTTKDYGTGLGLSVVHGIIQEHGGQIEVESELKKGTSFHILLPLVRFDREVAAA